MDFATSEVTTLQEEIKAHYYNGEMQLASQKADKLYTIYKDNNGNTQFFFPAALVLILNTIENYLQDYKKAKTYLDVVKQEKYAYIETTSNYAANGFKTFKGIPYGIKYSDKKEYHYKLKAAEWKLKLETIKNYYLAEEETEGALAINSLNLELIEAKKYLSAEIILEMEKSIKSINDDIAHIIFLNTIKASQKPNDTPLRITDEDLNVFTNKTEPEIYEAIGKATANEAKVAFDLAKTQANIWVQTSTAIPLPGPKTAKEISPELIKENNKRYGGSVIKALKETLYKAICDPKNRPGKDIVTKENIKSILLIVLAKQGITEKSIVVPIIALALMLTLSFFCNYLRPDFIKT